MKKTPPMNLALWTLNFPPMAIASILHRLSGIFVFLLIPLLLCALQCSLKSQAGFDAVLSTLNTLWIKGLLWLFLTALVYHLLAGIRHMLMDCGFGEHLCAARYSSYLLFVLTAVCAAYLGVVLW